jgi:hypothetical protein
VNLVNAGGWRDRHSAHKAREIMSGPLVQWFEDGLWVYGFKTAEQAARLQGLVGIRELDDGQSDPSAVATCSRRASKDASYDASESAAAGPDGAKRFTLASEGNPAEVPDIA